MHRSFLIDIQAGAGCRTWSMLSRLLSPLGKLAVSLIAGVLLRFVFGLHPVGWLVWLVPAVPLFLALRLPPRDARWMVALALVIGVSCNFSYFRLVMPLAAVLQAIVLQSLLGFFLLLASRRVIARYRSWWTILVYPVFCVAADTLMAALLPDGNWGSLAYSQGDCLPVLQIASLLGIPGLLFVLTLVPSTLAVMFAYGRGLRRAWLAGAFTASVLLATVAYGAIRLHQPVTGTQTTFGLIAIDDPIEPDASAAYVAKILAGMDALVETVAARGAQVVVLPEKVAVLTPQKASGWQRHFSALARQNHIWLEVGIGLDDGHSPTNWAWLFTPEGQLALRYEKHFMAPPERRQHYAAGAEYSVLPVNGSIYGLAICKDMHFAALGRAYGQRHAAVMLVPAWDFAYMDGWLEARTTVLRGIENGYSIVRSSREGMLTASDPYGRVLAEIPSRPLPGQSLLATASVAAQIPTLYTRIGALPGWLCVAAAVVLLVAGRAPGARDRSRPALAARKATEDGADYGAA